MNKKKIIGLAGAVVVCILVFVFIVIRGKSPNPAENPEEMLGRIENALGDEYKKQSMTELVATLKYGDEEGMRSTITYSKPPIMKPILRK